MSVDTVDYDYLKKAMYLASYSTCLMRKIGCVLVGRSTHSSCVRTLGMDGEPYITGCNSPALTVDCVSCVRGDYASGEGYDVCPAVHAEAAAICRAALEGFACEGSVLYSSTTVPCKWCAGLIVRAGVARVVCIDEKDEVLPDIQVFGEKILRAHGVEVVKVDWNEVLDYIRTQPHALGC